MDWQAVLYFLLWAGLFAVMMRYGCGAHVMGHGRNRRKQADQNSPGGETGWSPPEQVVDPVCGKSIRASEAKSAMYYGRACYFCSPSCREKFEAAPATYANSESGIPLREEEHHHGSHC
jgi:YHS domain-containing protein